MRRVVRECAAGCARGDQARVERELGLVRLVPVVREELRRRERREVARRGRRREALGPSCVQTRTFDRQELAVHRLGHEDVAEPDRVALDGEDVQVHCFPDRGRDRCEVEADHGRERLLRDRRTRDGNRAHDLAHGFGASPEAREHDVAQGSVERAVGTRRARGAQFLDDQGIARRAIEDLRHRERVDVPDEGLDQARHLRGAQGRDRDRRRELCARHLGEKLTHRMLTRELVVAACHDEPDRPVDDVASQDRQDLACAAVGPVHVLDHEQQ